MIGIEDHTGSTALQYAHHQPVIDSPEFALAYTLPNTGFVQGHVTDLNDGSAIGRATVTPGLTAVDARSRLGRTRPGSTACGFPWAAIALETSARHYAAVTEDVTVEEENQVVTADVVLATGRAALSADSLDFAVARGDSATATLTVTNTGSLDLDWSAREMPPRATGSPASVERDTLAPPAPPTQRPNGYAPTAAVGDVQPATALVLMDALPWGSDAIERALRANGISYAVGTSADMGHG